MILELGLYGLGGLLDVCEVIDNEDDDKEEERLDDESVEGVLSTGRIYSCKEGIE